MMFVLQIAGGILLAVLVLALLVIALSGNESQRDCAWVCLTLIGIVVAILAFVM